MAVPCRAASLPGQNADAFLRLRERRLRRHCGHSRCTRPAAPTWRAAASARPSTSPQPARSTSTPCGRRFSAAATDDTSSEVGIESHAGILRACSATRFSTTRSAFLINGSYSKRNSQEQSANIDGWLQDQFAAGDPRVTSSNDESRRPQLGAAQRGLGSRRSRAQPGSTARRCCNSGPSIRWWPRRTTRTPIYKDNVNRHTFGAWFDYGPNPTSATINSHGTVHQSRRHRQRPFVFLGRRRNHESDRLGRPQREMAGHATTSRSSSTRHHSSADSGGGASGNNNFGIVGQNPQLSLNKFFSMGNTTIPFDLAGRMSRPTPPSNLDRVDHRPVVRSGQQQHLQNGDRRGSDSLRPGRTRRTAA